MNDKIKTMKRKARGHPGHEFKVKILATPTENVRFGRMNRLAFLHGRRARKPDEPKQ
jgi:hypothetical protein